METSNTLIYRVSKTTGNEKINVVIRLDENCKNGYEYFSMTCSGYEKARNRWIDTFGGCAHDEILKVFPQFEIFKTVHLWSFGGFGRHSVANGFYFLKNGFNDCGIDSENFPKSFCKYFNCTAEQFDILKDSENEIEFSILLIELGIVEGWKKIVKKAIAELEKLTGLTFKSEYSRDKNDITIDADKLKEFRQRKKDGFYSKEAKEERENKRFSDLKTSMIEKVNADFKKEVLKHEKDRDLKLALIDAGHEVNPRTGNLKACIYYEHSNELNFNWSSEKVSSDEINLIIEKLDKNKFKGLAITNDKKLVTQL